MRAAAGLQGSEAAGLVAWLPPIDAAACEGQPRAVVSALKRAHALAGAQRYEEALALLDQPRGTGGTAAEMATGALKRIAYSLRGLALHALGRPAEAAEALSRAVKLTGLAELNSAQAFGAYGLLGISLLDLGRIGEAVEAFSRGIEHAWTLPPSGSARAG